LKDEVEMNLVASKIDLEKYIDKRKLLIDEGDFSVDDCGFTAFDLRF